MINQLNEQKEIYIKHLELHQVLLYIPLKNNSRKLIST
jgi:hypothetical protein